MKNFLARVKQNRIDLYTTLFDKIRVSRMGVWFDDSLDTWYICCLAIVTAVCIKVSVYVPIYVMSVFKALFNKEGK